MCPYVEKCIDFVFPDAILSDLALSARTVGASLLFITISVDLINDAVLKRVPGDAYTLHGRTRLDHEHLECDV